MNQLFQLPSKGPITNMFYELIAQQDISIKDAFWEMPPNFLHQLHKSNRKLQKGLTLLLFP